MDCCDDGLLSKAIDWKGQFNPGYHDDEPQDSDDEFQEHLEKLLNTSGVAIATDSSDFHTTIPISDSRIPSNEVTKVLEDQVNQTNVVAMMAVLWEFTSYYQVYGFHFCVSCSMRCLRVVILKRGRQQSLS